MSFLKAECCSTVCMCMCARFYKALAPASVVSTLGCKKFASLGVKRHSVRKMFLHLRHLSVFLWCPRKTSVLHASSFTDQATAFAASARLGPGTWPFSHRLLSGWSLHTANGTQSTKSPRQEEEEMPRAGAGVSEASSQSFRGEALLLLIPSDKPPKEGSPQGPSILAAQQICPFC